MMHNLLSQSLIIDHLSVNDFERIPEQYKNAAANTKMLFMDRSVGANISSSLDCLSNEWASAPSYCKRYQHRDSQYAVQPSEVYWKDRWDRSNWRYEFWPANCAEDVSCFIDFVNLRLDSFEVMGCQFSYLSVLSGSKLADSVNGFFGSKVGKNHASHYANFAQSHSDKKIIWWTTSLARGIGTIESQAFNDQMRDYAKTHSIILFDVADILSHDPSGKPCYDNRDGIDYFDEMHPDDGLDIPAICPQYTTETEGGHLGSIAAGGIRVAKAFWVLMARIAGWDGVVTQTNERMLNHEIKWFFDPTDNKLNLVGHTFGSDKIWLECYNLQGNKVLDGWIQDHDGFSFSMKKIPSGLYIIRLQKGHTMVFGKIILY